MKRSARVFISIISACIIIHISSEANENTQKEDDMNHIKPTLHDVCDMNRIYNDNFQYSLPRNILESFLSGKAFDHKEFYTQEELSKLREDINEIAQTILPDQPVKKPLAVITAGAPGAGKTVKMHQDLDDAASRNNYFAYICPDDVCLQGQTRTYGADVADSGGTKEERQAAYNKWRPGSNAATHLILANLIREKYGFYYGTTSSGPATGKFFEFLKKQGYEIRLIHVTAPDDVRWGSIQERDKTFVQTTEQDVREKGLLLPQRISDTFLKYADRIEFYYRGAVKENAQLAAVWIRNESSSPLLGTLTVISPPMYKKIQDIHDAATESLKRPDLRWKLTVEDNSAKPTEQPTLSDEKQQM